MDGRLGDKASGGNKLLNFARNNFNFVPNLSFLIIVSIKFPPRLSSAQLAAEASDRIKQNNSQAELNLV